MTNKPTNQPTNQPSIRRTDNSSTRRRTAHQAGGTTLQGLLDRYGADRHLLVATPEHVRRTTSFHRGKANILSRHCTLMTFVELKFIYRPYLFVTLLREPLSLAVSMFYWKHQEKRAAPFKYSKFFFFKLY